MDDEPLIGEIIARFLEHQPVHVQVETSGADALRVLAAKPFDIVLADMIMPGMSGVEFLEQVMERWPKMVCGLVTAHPWPDSIIDAVNRGHVRKVLVKPLDRTHVEAALNELISECLATGRH